MLKLDNVFIGDAETLESADLFLFDFLHQALLSLPGILELLVFYLFHLLSQLSVFLFFNDLLLKLVGVLLEELFSFFFQLLLHIFQLSLLPDCRIKFSLLSFCLLFESSFFFQLLLQTSFLKFFSFIGPLLSFMTIFISGCSFVGFNCPFGSQSIEFSLSIRCFFLEFSEFLNLFFLLFFDPYLLWLEFSFFISFVLDIAGNFFLFLNLFGLALFDNKDGVFVGF